MNISYFGPGKHLAFPYKDKEGRESLVVALKITFNVDPSGKVEVEREDPAVPSPIDEYNGPDPTNASIRRPSDLYEHKPGTDVILVGHAHPPRDHATHVDVTLRAGPVEKIVRAHGLRVWQRGVFGGVSPGPARPIQEPIPLIYELAWGGLDLSDPERPVGDPRNTVGRGVARDVKELVGAPAAQLEDPGDPIGVGAHVPWCFGAIHRHWAPRASFAGTYDEAWMEQRMPLPPEDYDPRFNVSVPHDQWSPVPLRGDEPIEVLGATPEGAWRFRLPRISLGFSSRAAGARAEHRTHLDTIYIDADARRVELTSRAQIPMPRKYELLETVYVFEKELV